jgi:M6 family metalloprotease-like protein
MKKKLLALLLMIVSVSGLFAAPFRNMPTYFTQPDGTRYDCFISGDEYYQYLHDADGFIIVNNPADNWFYYATKDANGEQIISGLIPGKGNPATFGLKPYAFISAKAIEAKHNMYKMPERKSSAKGSLHEGTIQNLVVYIKFADDADFTNNRNYYDGLFNSTSKKSLKDYYDEVSYGKLNIVSNHFPVCDMTTNLAYIDSHNRNYYQPYNATSNPNGYIEGQQASREHTLLKNAINSVKSAIEEKFTADELDINGDGEIDNICFIVRGQNGEWNELLWAHSWALYTYTVEIHNKQVNRYTWQPETQADVYTFCHEMFHALGAPDLYHYNGDSYDPVGSWDLMNSGFVHMGAWMKFRYTNQTWITDIPEITKTGTYKLKPLASSDSNCFKIRSIKSDTEFYIVEYRDATGNYEYNIPGSGLLVYRINSTLEGNANGSPDEVYIYRPGGTTTLNGNINNAYYSSGSGRTQISDNTSPSGFLTDGTKGGLNISNIGEAGTTISFNISLEITNPPASAFAQVSGTTSVVLNWESNANNDSVVIAYATSSVSSSPATNKEYQVGDKLTAGETIIYSGQESKSISQSDLLAGKTYYYKIWAKHNGIYSSGISTKVTTYCDEVNTIPYAQGFGLKRLPSCWNVLDNQHNSQVWEFNNIGEVSGFKSYTESNGFACINSAYYGLSQDQNTDLVSPAFDFTNNPFIYLQFIHYLNIELDRTEASFMYSIDSCKTWNTLKTWTSSTNNPELYAIDLSELLAGQPNVRFKWNFKANADRFWCIDDFQILDKLLTVGDVKNKNGAVVSPYRNQIVTLATTVTKIHPASGYVFTQDSSGLWSGLPIPLEANDNLWSKLKAGDSLIITSLINDASRIPYLNLPFIEVAGTAVEQQIPVREKLSTIKENVEAYKGLYVKCDSLTVDGWDNVWMLSEKPYSLYISDNDTYDYALKKDEVYNISGIYYEDAGQAYLVPLSKNDISEWVGIDGKETTKSLNSYPNPFNDYLVIELQTKATVKLFDLSGKVILQQSTSGDKTLTIDTHSLKPGVYMIEVADSNQRTVLKAIKSE